MSKKLDELFKTYAYDPRQKAQLRLADEKQLDVSVMKDPKYNWEQMREILLAMEYGIDPEPLCDPEISAESMEKIRYSLMNQQSVFENAKEEIKNKRIKRFFIMLFSIIGICIIFAIYLMNKDLIDKYIEPVPLELSTDKVTIEYGDEIHFIDYVKYYNKNQTLTIPLNQVFNKTQDYHLTYSATNGIKKTTKQLTVKVVDTTKPYLELTQNEITVNKGESFQPQNYIKSVKDNYDSLTVDDVTVNNDVDINKAGDYEVDYSLKDQHGNVAELKMKVHVIEIKQSNVELKNSSDNSQSNSSNNNKENRNKSEINQKKNIQATSKIFLIRDYNYDLSACSLAAENYMNDVLNSSNESLNGYIEPYQEDNQIIGYKVNIN